MIIMLSTIGLVVCLVLVVNWLLSDKKKPVEQTKNTRNYSSGGYSSSSKSNDDSPVYYNNLASLGDIEYLSNNSSWSSDNTSSDSNSGFDFGGGDFGGGGASDDY